MGDGRIELVNDTLMCINIFIESGALTEQSSIKELIEGLNEYKKMLRESKI